jgi:uncharacterized protein
MPTIEEARAYYPEGDPIHGFSHVLRVYKLCERIAEAEGADLNIVRAAALLHDVDGDVDVREHHHLAAASFAEKTLREEGWKNEDIEAVLHCIRAHRFRNHEEEPETLEAQVLFDADKIDAIGAVGVARAVSYAVRAGMDVYAPPSPTYLETGELEPDESQTVTHEYLYKLKKIRDHIYTTTGRSLAAERHDLMVKFFEGWMKEIGDYAGYKSNDS